MRAIRHLLALVALTLAATTASAQFVKGNEAVKVMPDGTKKVETPPLPSTTLGAPCVADNPACTVEGAECAAIGATDPSQAHVGACVNPE